MGGEQGAWASFLSIETHERGTIAPQWKPKKGGVSSKVNKDIRERKKGPLGIGMIGMPTSKGGELMEPTGDEEEKKTNFP